MKLLYHSPIAAATSIRAAGPPPLSASPARPAAHDGRVVRGERTRRALAEALIDLLEEGGHVPTARAVATRAGVSSRLVFHHFADMEEVLRAAVAVQAQRHWAGLDPVDPALPRAERIRRLVRQRAGLFEAVGPVRRAAMHAQRTSAVLSEELRRSRRHLRRQLSHTFGPDLARAGERRGRVLDALELSAGFESWQQLRMTMELGPGAAGRAMADLLDAVLRTVDDAGGGV